MGSITIPREGQFSKLTDAARLTHELMEEFGLDDWQFAWDRAKARLGKCSRRKKTITLSAPLTSLVPFAETEDTIRHEIAHAISSGSHGAEWKVACKRTGARPVRCADNGDEEKYLAKWLLTCKNGHRFYRHRRSRGRSSCPRCRPGRFDPEFLLSWEENPDYSC